ncbi:hypothetical protein D3C80_1687540 [compost metagenome]
MLELPIEREPIQMGTTNDQAGHVIASIDRRCFESLVGVCEAQQVVVSECPTE